MKRLTVFLAMLFAAVSVWGQSVKVEGTVLDNGLYREGRGCKRKGKNRRYAHRRQSSSRRKCGSGLWYAEIKGPYRSYSYH